MKDLIFFGLFAFISYHCGMQWARFTFYKERMIDASVKRMADVAEEAKVRHYLKYIVPIAQWSNGIVCLLSLSDAVRIALKVLP